MAKKYFVPIDMSGLEIQNFLAHNLATPPTGTGGKVYFNTTDHKLYYHNGTSWVDLTASSDTTYTLTKSGSTITLTDSNGNTWDVTDDDTTYSDATTSASGLMSASDKTKLNGIASGAEVNQNAFSNVKVGSTTIEADSKTDTIELVAGSNVTLTPDATNDKVTIEATDTTYSDATASTSGLMSASDKSKLNGIASGAEVNVQADWDQSSSSADDFIKNKPTLGTAAAKDSTTSITSGGTGLPTAGSVYDYVATAIGAVDAMRFKGTVNSNSDLPSSGVKVGDTYMVNTAGTYAGQTCEVGDLIIATATTPTWTVAQTNIDGAITSLTASDGISIAGIGSSRTIAFNASTAPKASASALGLMKVGDGLGVDYQGIVSAVVREANTWLHAGETSAFVPTISGGEKICVLGYVAYDNSTREEVMVDFTQVSGSQLAKFSIASAYSNDILIHFTYIKMMISS